MILNDNFNRVIKFRAWCKSNNEMYYPDENYEFWFDNNSIGFYPRYDKHELYHFNTNPSENEKEILVMQFTGLLDKNGKEIYEADILVSKFGHKYLVVWHDEGWKYKTVTEDFGVPLYSRVASNHEILGNVFENPELLQTI